MKIAIYRKDNNIVTIRNYDDIDDKGEVAHMVCELESIKSDLMEIWEKMDEDE